MSDPLGVNKITSETFDPKIHVSEYKRTCNGCGKTWHSLAEREAQIDPSGKCCDQDNLGECNTCGTNGAQAQYRRNIQSREDSLAKLKKCPQCGSGNYKTEIIYYDRK